MDIIDGVFVGIIPPQNIHPKKYLDIHSSGCILKLRKFKTGRPSDMGFVVCTINFSLVMESGTRKGRKVRFEPSQFHGLFLWRNER